MTAAQAKRRRYWLQRRARARLLGLCVRCRKPGHFPECDDCRQRRKLWRCKVVP